MVAEEALEGCGQDFLLLQLLATSPGIVVLYGCENAWAVPSFHPQALGQMTCAFPDEDVLCQLLNSSGSQNTAETGCAPERIEYGVLAIEDARKGIVGILIKSRQER